MKIAIIGAGHEGLSLAEKFISASPNVYIDLFSHIPAPFGLIHYGRFNNITDPLHPPQLRLFGNVQLGVDISATELKQFYDTVIHSPSSQENWSLDTTCPHVGSSDFRPDVRSLLQTRKVAYTSFEGWHYNENPPLPRN